MPVARESASAKARTAESRRISELRGRVTAAALRMPRSAIHASTVPSVPPRSESSVLSVRS